ncbi:heme lyase CcmF/NrfE family subunit [bacterium]|nr:heme lyase CcmF/NrfE family subunit [bacterium]
MISILGTLGVFIAVVGSAFLGVRGFTALARREDESGRWLKWPVLALLGGSLLAMFSLEAGLLADDFSVSYIANNSATTTPFLYKVASAWAALEGSIVLWGLVLAGFVFFVWRAHSRQQGVDALGAGALGVLGVVSLFFFVVMLTISNPFEVCTASSGFGCADTSILPWTTSVAAQEGFGPNPLLQNHPLMAIHPPMLYLGYVGLTVPFAFAISALLLGQSGDEWLRRSRSWTRIAWVFLTAGIVLGGLWSYEVLGWGGYWAWDPVENASFMPWLLATAFLHSSAVQIRRGVLQAWNFVLVIAAFGLTILGTFLTRSGVIVSVHSFTQSAIGPALLWFLMLILVGSLGLFAMRAHLVSSSPRLDSLSSREGVFLVNNLLLVLFAFVVLLGTLYPMIIEAVSGDTVGVGRPFYDKVAIPISFLLILAMGIGPFTPYRSASPKVVWERIKYPLLFGLGVGALLVSLGQRNGWIVLLGLLSGFIIGLAVRQLWTQSKRSADKKGRKLAPEMVRTMRSDPSYWGGQIAHIGVAVLALGIAISSNLASETVVELSPGESDSFDGYTLVYVEPFQRVEENRTVTGARMDIYRSESKITTLEPRLNQYKASRQSVASPAVNTGLRGDLYLSLASIDSQSVTLEVYSFPLIWLVWVGGFLAASGGVFAWLVKPAAKPVRREEASADA